MKISFLKYFCQSLQLSWLGGYIPILGSSLDLEIKLKLCFNRAGRYVSGRAAYLRKARETLTWIVFPPSPASQVLGYRPWEGCLCLYHFASRVGIEKDWKLLCAKGPREELKVNFTRTTAFHDLLLIIPTYHVIADCFVPWNCVDMHVLLRHLVAKLTETRLPVQNNALY